VRIQAVAVRGGRAPHGGLAGGANGTALEAFGGLAERSTSGWSEALVGLVAAGDDVRARLGALARRGVDEHYSFARWAPTWRATVLG
jgi:hypothetical protein